MVYYKTIIEKAMQYKKYSAFPDLGDIIGIPKSNHKITQIFTRKHFLERKALPTTFLPSVKTFSLFFF